jgi:hypothetical protein
MAFLGGLLGAMFRAGCRQAPQLGRIVPWPRDCRDSFGGIPFLLSLRLCLSKTSVDCVVRGV